MSFRSTLSSWGVRKVMKYFPKNCIFTWSSLNTEIFSCCPSCLYSYIYSYMYMYLYVHVYVFIQAHTHTHAHIQIRDPVSSLGGDVNVPGLRREKHLMLLWHTDLKYYIIGMSLVSILFLTACPSQHSELFSVLAFFTGTKERPHASWKWAIRCKLLPVRKQQKELRRSKFSSEETSLSWFLPWSFS